MSQPKHYTGGCHCGAVRYEVETDLAATAVCNCSLCQKAGWVLAFAPAGSFKLVSGEANLTDYQFHKKVIHHVFCKTCGVRSFSRGTAPDGRQVVAVNVLCLDGVEPDGLTPRKIDGRKL